MLYLSGYILNTRAEYYRLLRNTRDTDDWEPWLLYMLQGVETTSKTTVALINSIRHVMNDCEERIRRALPKIYSYELLNNLFRHPYTRIEAVQDDLGVSRLTASKYLSTLTEKGFVEKHRFGVSIAFHMRRANFILLPSSNVTIIASASPNSAVSYPAFPQSVDKYLLAVSRETPRSS